MSNENVVFGLRPPAESRYATQYDGTEFTEVRDVKIVERFAEQVNTYTYTLTGLLFKVKAKGFKFNLLADLDGDGEEGFWFIDLSMLKTNIDEILIIQDYIRHELAALCGEKKVRVEFKEPEDEVSDEDEE